MFWLDPILPNYPDVMGENGDYPSVQWSKMRRTLRYPLRHKQPPTINSSHNLTQLQHRSAVPCSEQETRRWKPRDAFRGSKCYVWFPISVL